MILKKIVSLLTAAAVMGTLPAALPDIKAGAADIKPSSAKEVTKYSYEITPLLAPFNEYFFVKTDNPDPWSFAFVDKDSKYKLLYGDDPVISVKNYSRWNLDLRLYADVDYEDTETGRVGGGYIFYSGKTDGGELTLQYRTDTDVQYAKWKDTNKKYTIPKLKSSLDYLIDTYATKSDLFENLDAVSSGLSSICLYSGSWVRGELFRAEDYWSMSTSPHKDQTFYIQSPYLRLDDKPLLASEIYPYRLDSIAYPSMMASVAEKLAPDCTVEWDDYLHYVVYVTYNGTTKTYGGTGIGKGQGISKDKITRSFTFKKSDPKITLSNIKSLLDSYSMIQMDDDIPKDDALTMEQIWKNAGSGKWIRIKRIGVSSYSDRGSNPNSFAYIYQKADGDYFHTSDVGDGSSLYWSGDLGYASDCWVDGRYVNKNERIDIGAKFEDHPTSKIIIRDFKFPEVTYKWTVDHIDDETGNYVYRYSDVTVKNVVKPVKFVYNKTDKVWRAVRDTSTENSYYTTYKILADQGLLAKKYLDAIELTPDEVKALKVDANTDLIPKQGLLYDGTASPGTPFNYAVGDVNFDGSINMKDVAYMQKYLNGDEYFRFMDLELGDTFKDGTVNMKDVVRLQRNVNGWDEPMG